MKGTSFEQVLVDFEPLIKGQMKKLNIYKQHEEYYQVGVIALWLAYQNFDEEKGVFAAYAFRTVRGHLLMHLQKERRFSDRHAVIDGQESQVFERAHEGTPSNLEHSMFLLSPYTETLTPREKLWVIETFVFEKKLGEIAADNGVSRNTVSTWRKNALKKLPDIIASFDR